MNPDSHAWWVFNIEGGESVAHQVVSVWSPLNLVQDASLVDIFRSHFSSDLRNASLSVIGLDSALPSNEPLRCIAPFGGIIAVSDKFNDYAYNISESLKAHGVRVDVDSRSEKIGSKIRDAEMQKINIMVIVGEKEVEDKTLTIRRRFIKQQQTISLEDFSTEILGEINDRRVPN